ncbi:hypothetical protein [Pseudorhodoplanes sp.]|uniref:hypothetical protein n=1 Tax=Pseudorhodoplanes sp. TaxID=1934341 RepID=UPI002D0AE91D|nr:hypothetical protein [Pseudorhodoplanes sp.]HWV44154.1 hypothetical protein [Pseudorhodoplanes sp.]
MTQRKNDPLLNLADAMVEDILGMSDEEILAECTPEELAAAEKVRAEVTGLLDRWSVDAKRDNDQTAGQTTQEGE